MSSTDLIALCSLALAALSLLITILWHLASTKDKDKAALEKQIKEVDDKADAMAVDFADVKGKVNALWSLLMRGGLAEGRVVGLFERKSPLKLNIDVIENHRDLLESIRLWYAEEGNGCLSDLELIVKLENQFGAKLQKICEDSGFKIRPAAVLMAVMFLCRPQSELFTNLEHYHEHFQDIKEVDKAGQSGVEH